MIVEPNISDYAGTMVTTDNKRGDVRAWFKPKPLSDSQIGNLSLVLIIPSFLGVVYVMLSNYPILWFVPITIVYVKYHRTIRFWIGTVL